jgi:hypothetical protein
MRIFFAVIFAFIIWIALFKMFFDDAEEFWETAKENSLWFAISLIFDTVLGGVRFLIFAAVGIIGGILLYNLL